MKRVEYVIALVLTVLSASGKLGMGASLLLLFAAWVIAVYGIYDNDAPKGFDRITALKIIVVTLGSIALSWWIHIPIAQSFGTLTAQGPPIAVNRLLEIGNSGAVLNYEPRMQDPHLMYLANMNQSLLIEPKDGKLILSAKVLDKNGNLLVEIDGNHWHTPERPQISDWNYTKNTLEVLGPADG